MYLSINHFYHMLRPAHKQKQKKEKKRILPLFWSVVVSIEMMDIVFSIDSVLASLAISPNPVIVLIGGLIGILAMRGIAEVIMKLMDLVPELEVTAYILIALIAIKLFLTIPMIDIEIPAALFGVVVLGALALTVFVHHFRQRK
ncbi:TerC faamily membrane protein [Ligilactobacillus equi DPC 6820]|uniref:TerC faamily membrane protein n=3 Tax=Ligilactobacillus equi TaxID=137357 RepID=V7HVX4_9LACO|nr:TerC faamily membrane protein [Ligilactobacillus equi DPC 6820]